MLPTAGACAAILAGASHAWAVSGPTATSTTPAGATTTSTLTWDVSPNTGSVNCQLSWDNGSGTAVLLGSATSCPFTNNPADPSQVAYAVPGQHAGKYALVASTPSAGSATSTYVDVKPVTPTLTGPAGPSNNRTPSWTIATIDPEGAVTCSATSPQLASVSVSCTPTPDGTGHGTVSLDLASAANDASITVTVTVTAHGESSSATTSYALDVTAPTPATLTPTSAAGTGRTPSFTVGNVESGATVACTLTDQNNNAVSGLISACDSTHAALNLTGAPDSVYTLAVTLTDAAGNSSTNTATYTLLPPAPVVTAPASPARDDHPTFTVSESDPSVTLTCTLTGLAGATLASPCTTGSVVVDLSGAASDGTVRLTVTATDAATLTNSGSAAYTVDRQVTAPTLTLGSTSSTSHQIVAHAGDSAPDLASLSCAVTDGSGATVVAPAPCSASTTIDLPAGALDGNYTVTATATDAVGNTSSTTATYALLPPAPVVTGPASPARNDHPTFTVSEANPGETLTCTLSGLPGATLSSCGTGNVVVDLSGAGDGTVQLTVTATDADNLSNSGSATYTIDRQVSAPTLTLGSTSGTSHRIVVNAGDTASDLASLTCVVTDAGGATVVAASPCNSSTFIDLPASALDGDYTVTATAADTVGNTASTASTYTLLQSAPVLAPLPAPSTSRTVGLSFDPGADAWSVTCSVAGPGGFSWTDTTCVSPGSFVIPASALDGDYVLTVTVTDHLGSSLSASDTYTLMQSAPVIAPLPARSTNRTVAFTFDPGADASSVTCTVAGPGGFTWTNSSCTSPSSFTIPASALDGDYVLTVTVTDHLGSSLSDSGTYTLTQSAPVLAALPAASTDRTVAFSFDPGADASSVTCSVAGPGGFTWTNSSCTSPSSFVIPASALDGDYVLTVTVTDHLGSSLSDSGTYTLTQSAPVLAPLPAPSTNRTVDFSFDPGADASSVTCTVAGPGGFTWTNSSCTSPSSFTIPASALDGDYVLTVTVADHLGSSLSDSHTYTLMQSAPVLGPMRAPSTNRAVDFTFDPGADASSVTCTVAGPGGFSWANTSCVSPGSFVIPASALDGDYVLTVTVADHLGSSLSDSGTYTLTQSAPVLAPLPAPSTDRTVAFSFDPGEDASSVTCTVAGPGGFTWTNSSCTSPSSFTIPASALDGDYVLTVTVTDHLGSSLSDTATYTLLQSAPAIAPLPAPSTDRTVAFSFDPGADASSVTCTVAGPGGFTWTNSSCTSPSSFVIPASGLDGDYVLTVTVTDHLGHSLSDSGTYTLLQSAPVLAPLPAPSTDRTVAFSFDPGADVASVTCSVTGPGGFSWTNSSCTSPTSFVIPASALDGDYVLTVTVTDHLGSSLSDSGTYTLLQSAPVLAPLPAPSTSRTVAFSFEPGADASSVTCSVTGPGGFSWTNSSCVSPGSFVIPASALDGDYVLTVTVTDHLGSSLSDSGTYTLTQSAPVLAPLPAPSTSRTVAFSFDPGADASSVTCSVAGPGGWTWTNTTCVSPGSFVIPSSGLDGAYVLTVTVTDHLGHSLSDSRTYTLLPSAPYLTGPAPATTSNRQPSWTITDDVVDLARYECTSSVRILACGPTVQLDLAGLVDGTYSVSVDVLDSTGARSMPLVLSIGLIPPAPYATASPSTPASTLRPTWTIADDVVDLSRYLCTSSVRVVSCASTVQLDLSGLVDGSYSVTVQAVDAHGVAGDPVTLSFTLIPPAPRVVAAPASPASSRTPQWTFGDAAVDATGYTCSASGPGGISVTANCSATSSVVSLDLTGLIDGTYTLTVRAADQQGRTGDPFSVTYTLIPPAPVATASPSSPSSTRSPQWTLTDGAVDLDHYSCSSRVRVSACGSAVQLDLTGLVDGTYSVTVQAVDSLGHAGDPVTFSFTMTPPAPYVVTPPVSPASALKPSWTIRDDVVDFARYTCTSAVRVLVCGSTVQLDLTGLADGTYSVTVQAVDARGAAGDPLVLSYTLIPPAPVATSSPTSPAAVRQPSWSVTDAAVGPVTYICSATGPGGVSAPVSCSGGASVVLDTTGLPDGTYTVVVRAVDSLGAAGDAATFTYLLVPPPPTVSSAPASPWNSRSPQWTVTDAVGGVTYSCIVTGPTAASVSCTGGTVTVNLTGAADGTYTVSVLAVDSLGHSSDPAAPLRLSYLLDTTAPVAPSVAVTPSPSQGRTATYMISGVEPSGTVTCAFAAPAGSTVTLPTSCGTGATINLTGQPDGSYVLRVTVTDAAGNTSAVTTATYVLDTTAPAAPIATIASPGNDVTPTPTLVVEPGVTLTCTVQRFFVTFTADVPCGTDGTVDLTGFADGEFEISLWATDAAGNVGPASTYVYVLDTVPPATPLVAEPATPSPIVDPTWLWTPEIDTTAACTLTARDGSAIAGPSPCDGTFTADLTAQPDGSYTFTLVVSDPAGNHATVTSVYVLDRTAPVPPTVVPPASPSSSMLPRWTITAPRGATLTCTLMRGRTVILGPGACPAGGVVSLAGQPDGTYTLRVTATDSAGNVSAPSITSYILDTQPPASPTLVYGSPSSGTDRSPYWGFTLPSGTAGRCELWYGGNLVSARNDCHGSVSFTLNGADGHYTIRIYAVDAAGNVSAPATAGYDLYGHGGGVGGGSTSGGTPSKRHRPTPPPTTVQRLLETLNAVTGQTAKKVRQAAGTVTSVLPTLPIVHDPLTTNVSHAVQNAINAVSRAGGGTGFPLLLLVIVGLFLMAQSRIDRRDPKLAFASVAAEDNLAFRPPPSRGDAR